MHSVHLAWYQTGFIDDSPHLLGACASDSIADAVIEAHKRNRDKDYEFRNAASWHKQELNVLYGVPTVRCNWCEWCGVEEDLLVCIDKEDGDTCKGCPTCHTDHYLMDMEQPE